MAHASEESKRLWSRGIVDLNAGHYTAALQVFDRAVAADPGDIYAHYYRGIARGRAGEWQGAVEDLRVAVEGNKIEEAPLELGVALVQAGDYRAAEHWLDRAQWIPRTDARASLFLGIAQLRRGELDSAMTNFERAEARDSGLRLTAAYYQGVVEYQRGHFDEAERHFQYVADTSRDTAMAREANAFLDLIHSGARAPFALYAVAGLQYDSNVVLAPSSEAEKTTLQISKQSDGRAVITIGGRYAVLRTRHVELSLGYEFFQSLHFQLTDFNLQDHRPAAQLVIDAGVAQIGLLARYDYYFLDTDSFLEEVSGLPWIAIPEKDVGRAEIYGRLRDRQFYQRRFGPFRDGVNYAAGARQFFYIGAPERYVWIGYRYDREEPTHDAGQIFAYDGHEGEIGAGWAFPYAINADLTYAYRNEQYDAPSRGREDNDHEVVFNVTKRLGDHFAVDVGYFGTIDDSNQAEFHYDRHIVSVALEAHL